MRIHTEVVIDMKTNKVISDKSYEYKGPIAQCGSGGGNAGKIEYPTYIRDMHWDLLNGVDAYDWDTNLTAVFSTATGNSPWSGDSAFDPTDPLAASWAAVCAYDTMVNALSSSDDWINAMSNVREEVDANHYQEDFVTTSFISFMQDIGIVMVQAKDNIDAVIDDTVIDEEINAYSRVLDDEVDNNVLTKFRTGMRDINAVNSSAFPIGEALILGMKGRDIAKYGADLRLSAFNKRNDMIVNLLGTSINLTETKLKNLISRNQMIINIADQVIKSLLAKVEFEKSVASLSIDAKTKHIIAMNEYNTEEMSIAENNARWDLEVFQMAGNFLAAPGGAAIPVGKKVNKGQSVLGGAASGAAIGSEVNPGWGTAIGAVVGAGAAYFMS